MKNYSYRTASPKDATTGVLSIANQINYKVSQDFISTLKEIESAIGITDCILEFAHTDPQDFEAKYIDWIVYSEQYQSLRRARNIYDVTVNNYTFNWEDDYEELVSSHINTMVTVAKNLMVLGDNVTCLDIRVAEINKLVEVIGDYCEEGKNGISKSDVIKALQMLLAPNTDNEENLNAIRICSKFYEHVSDDKFNDKTVILYTFFYVLNDLDEKDKGVENMNKDLEAFRKAHAIIDQEVNSKDVLPPKLIAISKLNRLKTLDNEEEIQEIIYIIENSL